MFIYYYSFTSAKNFPLIWFGKLWFPNRSLFYEFEEPHKKIKFEFEQEREREREEFVSQSPSRPFVPLFLNLVGLTLVTTYNEVIIIILTVPYMVFRGHTYLV